MNPYILIWFINNLPVLFHPASPIPIWGVFSGVFESNPQICHLTYSSFSRKFQKIKTLLCSYSAVITPNKMNKNPLIRSHVSSLARRQKY